MALSHIERMHLEDLCEKYGLDCYAEIDETLTYQENKTHLLELSGGVEVTEESAADLSLADLDRQAAELGRRVVTEKEHEDLVELKRLQEQLRKKAKSLSDREKLLQLRQVEKKAERLEEKIERREKPEMYDMGKMKRYDIPDEEEEEEDEEEDEDEEDKPKPKRCQMPQTPCGQLLWKACKKRKIQCMKCKKLAPIACKKKGAFPRLPKF